MTNYFLTSMLGFLAGDCIGSSFEYPAEKRTTDYHFKLPTNGRFTDDTVLMAGVAKVLSCRRSEGYEECFKSLYHCYPDRNYSERFTSWANGVPATKKSFTNGVAMRILPAALCADRNDPIRYLLDAAQEQAAVTNHDDEAAIAAQAVAIAGWLALQQTPKKVIAEILSYLFHYTFRMPHWIRNYKPKYTPISRSKESVPDAISCFLFSDSVEEAIRDAVSLGADADTQAAIAGGLAFLFHKKIPWYMAQIVEKAMDDNLKELLTCFDTKRYGDHSLIKNEFSIMDDTETILHQGVLMGSAHYTVRGNIHDESWQWGLFGCDIWGVTLNSNHWIHEKKTGLLSEISELIPKNINDFMQEPIHIPGDYWTIRLPICNLTDPIKGMEIIQKHFVKKV